MKIASKKAYKEWNNLSKQEQKQFESEACAFGFNYASEEEFGEETYDITHLHVIAQHEQCERSVDDIKEKLNDVYIVMQELEESLDECTTFVKSLRKFNRLKEKIKDIIEDSE